MGPLLNKKKHYARLLLLQISDYALERVLKHVSEVDRFTIFNRDFLDDDEAIANKQMKEDHWRESTKTLAHTGRAMRPLYGALTKLEPVLNLGEPYVINNLVALYSKKGCPQQKIHTDEGDGYQGLKFVSGVVALEEGTSLVIGGTNRRKKFSMSIPRGSVLVWDSRMSHAGAAYLDKENIRIHFFFALQGKNEPIKKGTIVSQVPKVQRIYECVHCEKTFPAKKRVHQHYNDGSCGVLKKKMRITNCQYSEVSKKAEV